MSPPPHGEEGGDREFLAKGLRHAGLVTEFVGTLLVLGLVGNYLDGRYGWNSWGLLAGLLTGTGLGLWLMVRHVQALDRK